MFNMGDSNKKQSIFAKEDLGVRDADGMLAKLFRTLLRDLLQMDNLFSETNRLALLNRRLEDWVRHPRNEMQHDRNKQSTLKGNLLKQLYATKMSPKVFLVWMQIWRAQEFEVIIRPKWENGKTTEHVIKFTNLIEMNISPDDVSTDIEGNNNDYDNTDDSPVDSGDRAKD